MASPLLPTGTSAPPVLGNIRIWLAIAFLARLYAITDPPLETSHHWRQTTVTMVARNFAEVGLDLLHPRMDTAGQLTGITGMEFPLLNALIALCITLLGPAHWYGRAVVLIVCTFGILSFHRLVARRSDTRTAFLSAMLLLFSLWFMYGRKIMPDVFALSLVLMGLERLEAALRTPEQWLSLVLGALLIMAGTLSKITAGCLVAAWPALVYFGKADKRRAWTTTAALALACIPTCWWYFHWVPLLVANYGYWHFFMGKPMAEGAAELWANLGRTLDNFYFDALRFSGSAMVIWGCLQAVRKRTYQALAILALVGMAFLLTMLKAGDTFWMHAYYVLPVIPVMAVLGGIGLGSIKDRRWAHVLLAIIVLEGLLAQANDFHVAPDHVPLLDLEQDLDVISAPGGLIAVNSAQVPTPMYFAHRRGWTVRNADLIRPVYLDSLSALGCEQVVVLKHTFERAVPLPWPVLLERDAYRIHGRP